MKMHISIKSSKTTIVITSLGICVIGTLIAALKLYYESRQQSNEEEEKQRRMRLINANGKLVRSGSNTSGAKMRRSTGSVRSMRTNSSRKELRMLKASALNDDVQNIPGEELLELGLDYLKQAIKSWETALDSIESAIYMQSQTLALPNNEHADLVYNLRRLLDSANDINLKSCSKLQKSSQTLQIIQSRLAFKQQVYAEALLRNNNEELSPMDENALGEMENAEPRKAFSSAASLRSQRLRSNDNDDNDSFVSAESDVEWLDDDLLRRFELIEALGDKNLMYEMGMSNVNLGRVSYRVSRANLLECKSDEDFAAKLYVIRMGFDRLLQSNETKQWFIDEGRKLLAKLMERADKKSDGIFLRYDDMVNFVSQPANLKAIEQELRTRDVTCFNFYDIALDFILLDAFEDLESPPSAITAVIQNRWLSQSFKETALSTACWSVLKAKRKLMKFQNGFMSRFYAINEYLAPVLAWGFLGTDEQLKASCNTMKSKIVEYMQCLFDINRTRYTNIEDLASDIESHSIHYLREIINAF